MSRCLNRVATKNIPIVIKTPNAIINNFLGRHAWPALRKKTPCEASLEGGGLSELGPVKVVRSNASTAHFWPLYIYWSVCGGRKRFIAPTWIFLPAGLLAGWLAWQLGWSAGVNTITGNIFNPSHTILAWVQSYTAELDQVSARKNVRGQLMEHVSMVLKNPWNLIQIMAGHAVKQ